MHNIIVQPVITEKSMADVNKSKFTFIVRLNATKKEIKMAVEKLFGVHVMNVATIVVKGKTSRVGARRIEVVARPIKKAIVALKSGEKIDAFEIGA